MALNSIELNLVFGLFSYVILNSIGSKSDPHWRGVGTSILAL